MMIMRDPESTRRTSSSAAYATAWSANFCQLAVMIVIAISRLPAASLPKIPS